MKHTQEGVKEGQLLSCKTREVVGLSLGNTKFSQEFQLSKYEKSFVFTESYIEGANGLLMNYHVISESFQSDAKSVKCQLSDKCIDQNPSLNH